jgi:hypothetical protein
MGPADEGAGASPVEVPMTREMRECLVLPHRPAAVSAAYEALVVVGIVGAVVVGFLLFAGMGPIAASAAIIAVAILAVMVAAPIRWSATAQRHNLQWDLAEGTVLRTSGPLHFSMGRNLTQTVLEYFPDLSGEVNRDPDRDPRFVTYRLLVGSDWLEVSGEAAPLVGRWMGRGTVVHTRHSQLVLEVRDAAGRAMYLAEGYHPERG